MRLRGGFIQYLRHRLPLTSEEYAKRRPPYVATPLQRKALRALHRAGPTPITVPRLADLAGLKEHSLYGLLTKLESRGWTTRDRNAIPQVWTITSDGVKQLRR